MNKTKQSLRLRRKLSVVLATRNEEENIADCLKSVKDIADEIIVFDEHSTDNTAKIAKKFGAKVFDVDHQDNFHITKQNAINKAKHEWILQLDADERITPKLASEIKDVLAGRHPGLDPGSRFPIKKGMTSDRKRKLLNKHTKILKSLNLWSDKGETVAFWIPRLNFFLGKGMKYAGRYPDPAIRLIKNGKARLPMKSVHEYMEFDGATAWLFNEMNHLESPNLSRYLARLNRYTDLQAEEHKQNNISTNFFTLIYYSSVKPLYEFMKLYFRYKGYKDGMRGFIWSAFSASHFPISYFKYYAKEKN